jgi:ubiquinone/menaquinone biosynthesis C-methylase UbiE
MSSSDIERWNAIADSWHRWIPHMHTWYEPATELMLDLANIGYGNHCLDIAAGDGDQSLTTAERVGPNGYVLAIDQADKLLAIAEKAAKAAGYSNIETRLMDGENLELPENSFDAVICRFALMFFEDPVQGLKGVKRVLKTNGKFSAVVYAENGDPEFLTALSTVQKYLDIDQPVKPAATSLGIPENLMQTIKKAGFINVEVHPLTLQVRMASTEECVRYLQDTSPTIRELLLPLSPDERDKVWQIVNKALAKYKTQVGFEVQHHVLVAAGSTP